jgi:hypothetical protein
MQTRNWRRKSTVDSRVCLDQGCEFGRHCSSPSVHIPRTERMNAELRLDIWRIRQKVCRIRYPVRPILGSHMRQVVKQREGHHDNENVHRPHRIAYSFIDTNVDRAALVGTLTSRRFAAIPTLFARVRRLMREGASYSLFVASTKVINNWRASWNSQRLAIRVSWFRDSA